MRKARRAWSFVGVYGCAHFGKSLFWHAGELLFAYFLTEVCGLPPHQMGLILASTLLLSAAADLLVGRLLARGVRSAPSAAKAQFAGAVLSGAAFLVFALGGLIPPDLRFGFALASLLAFRLAYPLFDVPQNAMLALATRDDASRARWSAARYVFGGLAGITVAAAFAPLLQGYGAEVQAVRFPLLATALVAIAVATSAMLQARARGETGGEPTGDGGEAPRRGAPPEPAAGLLSVLAMMFVFTAGASIFGKLEPYFAAYGLRSRLSGGTLMVCVAVGGVVGQPLWAWLIRRRSLDVALRVAAAALALGAAAVFLLARHGAPEAGLSGLLYGFGWGGLAMCLWTRLANIAAARPEHVTTLFGLFTFCAKTALACATVGVSLILAATDYRGSATDGQALFAAMTGAPIVGAALCLILSGRSSPGRARGSSRHRAPGKEI